LAELSAQERLQPSLLDRLTDDEPQQKSESRERRVFSIRMLREAVKRDLAWLLNTANLGKYAWPDGGFEIAKHPLVEDSVLNYGMPELAGTTASSIDVALFQQMVRQAIWRFEPRILKHTVRVRAFVADDQMNRNALSFEIEGELWAEPVPVHLFLRTDVDLETGVVAVHDLTGQSTGLH